MLPIDFFHRASRQHFDRVAIESPDRSLTYGELAVDVNALATALQGMQCSTGRIGICAGNSVEHVIALLAVLAAGKTWIPLNPRSSIAELDRIVEFTRPDVVLTASGYGKSMRHAPGVQWISLDQPFDSVQTSLEDLLHQHRQKVPVRVPLADNDIQAIKFTGGSTGVPKGVMQPVRAWRSTIINLADAYRFDSNSRNLLAAPITHGAGTYLLPVLAKGGCHVLLPETKPEAVLQALEYRGITSVFMPPTLFYMVMEAGAGRTWHFPKLTHLIYGGAPMPKEKIRQAQAFFGPVVGVTYGQTEAPQIVTYLTGQELMSDRYIQSVGRASMLSDFAIMAPDGALLPSGETGEIVVRGDMIMKGYLDQPDVTDQTIVDGWLHTGDLGYVDERGYLFLRGRRREVIITGGFNVYPVDVEDVLGKHPDIYECAVFGRSDEKWGEAVCAAVQLRAGSILTSDGLMGYAKDRLGSVKAPKQIEFLSSLPRNAVGKVDKVLLKRMIEGGAA